MELDAVLLSRAQFALTIMFHYLFPPLSIGLGAIMVIYEGLYLWTGDLRYEAATRFFTKIFAVNFAVGVASGIVMEFQFGTNWSTYSRFVGDVFGSALAAEGIFAFFLESGFLAVLVFGWDRVSPRMHFFSTLMVFFGSAFSAVWIVIANSWQQTPAGYHLVTTASGSVRAEITDFWAMLLNPSSLHRLNHVLLGSLLQGAFFVMSICAWYILRKRHDLFAKRAFTAALMLAVVTSWLQLVSGHAQANMVAEHQPAKLAAFEGIYETPPRGAGLFLIGWVDEEERKVTGVEVPGLLSLLVHGDFDTPVTGLDRIPDDEEPPVLIPFVTYHVMVGLGMFFLGITTLALILLWRGKLFQQRWLMAIFVVAVIGPYVANEAGWVAAEVGRQPWVVYGLLRTKDAVSPSVDGTEVLLSIVMFGLIYSALFAIWLFVVNEKIRHGPDEPEALAKKKATYRGWGLADAAAARAIPTAEASLASGGPRPEASDRPPRSNRNPSSEG